jgi:hypothetical protein
MLKQNKRKQKAGLDVTQGFFQKKISLDKLSPKVFHLMKFLEFTKKLTQLKTIE